MKRLYNAICELIEVKLEKHRAEIESLLPRDTGRMAKDRTPPSPPSRTWGEIRPEDIHYAPGSLAEAFGTATPPPPTKLSLRKRGW